MARTFKARLKTIPLIGSLAKYLYFRFLALHVVRSADYWENRYQAGGNSGAGSQNRLARFKAEVLNEFVRKNRIRSVVEFGCGDGLQLALADYPEYVGLDVSATAIELCLARFQGDRTKQFFQSGERLNRTFDLALSLDVIYHLVEDRVFEDYMHSLLDASHSWIIIYSSNSDDPTPEPHIRHRKFVDWIAQNRRDRNLVGKISNRYPFNRKNPDSTSFADFFIYEARRP